MKKLIISLFIFLILLPSTAQAQKYEWQDLQTQTMFGGEIPLIKDKLSLRGNTVLFFVPATGAYSLFAYAGPRWTITDWVWIAPQIGATMHWGWGPKYEDAFSVSLLTMFSFFKQALTILIDLELYLNKKITHLYGYYSVDFNFSKYASVGIQAEQVLISIMFGPHLSIRYKFWSMEVQYYMGFQEGINYGHNVRVVTALYFN